MRRKNERKKAPCHMKKKGKYFAKGRKMYTKLLYVIYNINTCARARAQMSIPHVALLYRVIFTHTKTNVGILYYSI